MVAAASNGRIAASVSPGPPLVEPLDYLPAPPFAIARPAMPDPCPTSGRRYRNFAVNCGYWRSSAGT
jgi:hypothetical protein